MSRFVVDASVTLRWCFEHQATDFTRRLLDRLVDDEAIAPITWPFEMANALARAERRNKITSHDVDMLRAKIRRLPIHVDATGHLRAFDEVLALASQCALTVYDAVYLELALRQAIPLATLDENLQRAARESGADLLEE